MQSIEEPENLVCLQQLGLSKSACSSQPRLLVPEHPLLSGAASGRMHHPLKMPRSRESKTRMRRIILVVLYTYIACASRITCAQARCCRGTSLPMHQNCLRLRVPLETAPYLIRVVTLTSNDSWPDMSGKPPAQVSIARKSLADGARSSPTSGIFEQMSHRPSTQVDRRALRTALEDRW
jgi:hypothetical protein